MKWRHSGSPRPQKNPSAKIRWKSSRLDYFWDQDGIFIIDYLPKGHTINVECYSAGAIKGHFEGKTPQEAHQGGLVLARQCPGPPRTCNPEETGLPVLPVS